MDKVVACIDGSAYSHSVCDHAAWAAARTGAPLQLVHVLGRREISTLPTDFSGSLGAGAQEMLLTELAALDEQKAKLAHARADLILDEAKARIAAQALPEAGFDRPSVTTALRSGDIVETLAEIEEHTSLLVIGKRGEAADFAKLHLGSNLERIARASRRPILVASRAFHPIRRFLIAFDGGPSAIKAVEYIAAGPLLRGLRCTILLAGSTESEARRQLDTAAARLRGAGFDVVAAVEPGYPEEVIAARVDDGGADLLVMGAYGHSRIRHLIIGSTTTEMVRSCRIPVLMFR